MGRDDEVAQVVSALTSGEFVTVHGPPGIGKSTVLGSALDNWQVAGQYGDRRILVRCDGALTRMAVVEEIAIQAGLALGDGLYPRVLSFLAEAPTVLVLDNFETVTDSDIAGASDLLQRLAGLRTGGLCVAVGYRGGQPPSVLTPHRWVEVPPLELGSAVDVFDAHSGSRFKGEDAQSGLVAQMDGVPLAIVLLARVAANEPVFEQLSAAWTSRRAALLDANLPGSDLSLAVSLALSWDHLSDHAQRCLQLASYLVDGWPTDRPDLYLGEQAVQALPELRGRALLHLDADRERCLAPIREQVLASYPPPADLVGNFVEELGSLAGQAARVGAAGGQESVAAIAPEFRTISEALRRVAERGTEDIAQAVGDLLRFQQFVGVGDASLGEAALEGASSETGRAELAFSLGLLYFDRSDNDEARRLFNDALPLYQQVGAVLGEANCLSNLGKVEFIESNNDDARRLFNDALPLYQQVGAVLGEANCLRNLGKVE
ncbi:MAG: tetratricopeptide repeat protein, partial [Actinomycetota bacterium]